MFKVDSKNSSANLEHISLLFLVFIVDLEQVYTLTE